MDKNDIGMDLFGTNKIEREDHLFAEETNLRKKKNRKDLGLKDEKWWQIWKARREAFSR